MFLLLSFINVGDVRPVVQAAVEHDVRQQQVIDMAAMARHVDDFVARRDVAHGFEMMHVDAVVELVPEAFQHELERAHDRVRIVGGDLHRVLARALAHGFDLDVLLARRRFDRGAHGIGVEERADDRATVRKIGSDDDRARAAEMHAQDALQLAHAETGLGVADRLAHRHRRRELHDRVAAVEKEGE